MGAPRLRELWRAVRTRLRPARREDLGRSTLSHALAASLFLGSVTLVVGHEQIFDYLGLTSGPGGACTTSLGGFTGAADPDTIPENFLEYAREAGERFDVPWEYVAALSWRETNHGRIADTLHYGHHGRLPSGIVYGTANPAGAAGPLQFGIKHPETGKTGGPLGDAANTWGGEADQPASERKPRPGTNGQWFGIDGNGDGRVNVWDPADAVHSAAGFLRYWMDRGHSIEWAVGRYHGSGVGGTYQVAVSNKAAQYRSGDFTVAPPNGVKTDCTQALNGTAVEKAIQFARAQTGKPYIWGGVGPTGYDCSGLLLKAYEAAGLPKRYLDHRWTTHTLYVMEAAQTVPSLDQAQPGDMILTGREGGGMPSHVSMVTGRRDGKLFVIEAYSSRVPLYAQIHEHEFDSGLWRQGEIRKIVRVSHLFSSGDASQEV